MPKKKTPRNAFYFFMRDYKEEQEQLGQTFPGGMKEVSEYAGPVWKDISPDQRLYYENLAAQEKMRDKGNLENKFTTTGVSYAQLHREEQERLRTELQMQREIVGTIQKLNRDSTLKTYEFYFIHFNYYCRIEDGSFLVCEVAVAQFSLKEGVKGIYHTLIRHDKIPTGYSFEAKQTSEDTHQIPMPQDLAEGEGEPYSRDLFWNIRSFLEQSKEQQSKPGQLPPLFTIDNHVDIAQCALTVLAENFCTEDPDIFRVYPLSKLFFKLRNASAMPGCTGFPAETLAERELDKDQYNFAPGIACSMHEQNDTCVYCSKSIVQRWAFLICDHCCRELNVPMLRGKHVPINAALNVGLPQQNLVVGGGTGDDDFQTVSRRNPRGPRGGNGGPAGRSSPPKVVHPAPIRVVDHSKISPPEETAHHFNLNAAAGRVPAAQSSGVKGAGGAWGSGGRGLVWGKPVATDSAPAGGTGASGGAAAAVSTSTRGNGGAIPKSSGTCWGSKPVNGEVPPPPTLRHPTEIPLYIEKALKFTDADFPDLGGKNHVRTAAAVAGRGRGRARILLDEGTAPGGLGVDPDAITVGHVAAGRGRNSHGGRPGSRLAANFQGLSLH